MRCELVGADDIATEVISIWAALEPRSVVLAGGTTPRALYERLRPEADRLQLDAVTYYFGDERCVPPEHPDSNFAMANETLLSGLSPATTIHPMDGTSCRADEYEAVIDGVGLDLILLGLGTDGHTCSLFPGDPALDERTRLVARVQRPDHSRLTLTFPAINAARVGVFLVAGASKGDALEALMAREPSIPASRVACEQVFVVADSAARAAAGVGS